MTEILLIRHGQASLGAESYDQLSDLGYQQARWLGQHLAQCPQAGNQVPWPLYTGQMARQRQTAEAMAEALALAQACEDAGFDEFDFESVILAYLGANPGYVLPASPSKDELYQLLKAAMCAWARNDLPLAPTQEPWLAFHQRVARAWQRFEQQPGPALLVSSAGVIASILRRVQGLDDQATIDLNLQIRNTSVTRLVHDGAGFRLAGFNELPHLSTEDRAHAVTFA